jgi:hypothetical protein
MMTTIDGISATGEVFVDGVKLELQKSLKVIPKSPTGFSWGYGGSGPAQLALAILLEFTDSETAKMLYHRFKEHFIVGLPFGQDFKIRIDVRGWIETEKAVGF